MIIIMATLKLKSFARFSYRANHKNSIRKLSKLWSVTKMLKGPFTNDVSSEGEGGGQPNSDERKGGCVNLVLTMGGGRGSKILRI